MSQRRREIGIRLALGAQRGDVLQMVLRQGTKTALVGVAIAIAAALGLTEFMTSLLFGVSAQDPATFAGVAALLILVAFLASYIPAPSHARRPGSGAKVRIVVPPWRYPLGIDGISFKSGRKRVAYWTQQRSM